MRVWEGVCVCVGGGYVIFQLKLYYTIGCMLIGYDYRLVLYCQSYYQPFLISSVGMRNSW